MMKQQFHYPKDQIYLCSHSVGLRPKRTEWTQKFYQLWQDTGALSWPKWLEIIEATRSKLALLLKTDSSQICPQVNVSSTLAKIIPSLKNENTKKKHILLSEKDFPTNGYAITGIAQDHFEFVYIPRCENLTSIDTWEKYLSDKVWLAHITHATSHTGELLPLKKICDICRKKNILTIIDIAQSVGIKDINLEEIQPDFAVGSSIKWLCGGPGASFLWVRKELLQLCYPKDRGWFSHKDPFSQDIHNFDYAFDARRFWGGTPSVLPYANLLDSLEILLSIGIDKISNHNDVWREGLLKIFEKKQIPIINPKDKTLSSGTLVVSDDKFPELKNHLQKNNIIFDQCSKGIRLSPHIYNDQSELHVVSSIIQGL